MIYQCIKEWKNYINLCGGGGEYEVGEYIQNPSGAYSIKLIRTVKYGPIQILLTKTGSNKSKEPISMTYEQSLQYNFKTDSTNDNYLITIDGGNYPEPEKKLSNFLKNTDSMTLTVPNHAKREGRTEDDLFSNMALMQQDSENFFDILKGINRDL